MNLIADGNGAIDFVEPVVTESPVATQSAILATSEPLTQVASASWVKTAIPWFLIVLVVVIIGVVVYKRMKAKK